MRLLLTLMLLAILPFATAQGEEDPTLQGLFEDMGDLGQALKDGALVQLVHVDDPQRSIADGLFWRQGPAWTAASTFPKEVRVNGKAVIEPKQSLDEANNEVRIVHLPEGRIPLPGGDLRLLPGNILVRGGDGGKRSSDHPAVVIAEDGLRLRCAPVRFLAVDPNGQPVPRNITVACGDFPLVARQADFAPLIMWLPVGLAYQSDFGSFRLEADGTIVPEKLVQNAILAERTLTLVTAAPPRPPAPAVPEQLELGGEAGTLAVDLPRRIAPGEPLRFAVSRAAWQRFPGGELNAERFAGRLAIRGVGPGSLALPQLGAPVLRQPPTGDDTVWIEMGLPAGSYGAVPVQIGLDGQWSRADLLVVPPGELQLIPHRGRLAYAHTETATFSLGGVDPASEIRVHCSRREAPLGVLPPGTRAFTLPMSDLPAGTTQLWIETAQGASGKLPIEVVHWQQRADFLAHTISCCIGNWPSGPEDLQRLHAMGFEMLTMASGHGSTLGDAMPTLQPELAPELPPAATVARDYNDYVLDRFLRAGLRHIDLTVLRDRGFYMESLSYHHSYQPNVDRMLRRLQVFAQQTADYPSFYGTNISWFPQLRGYAEGGVDTDAHRPLRNRALDAWLQEAGVSRPKREELTWYHAHKFAADPAEREKALAIMQRAVDFWVKEQARGFGDHNRLYAEAVRAVRPGIVTTLFENAGHDLLKRTRDLFAGMTAPAYESYTDFGDWPMSAGFTVDWALGQSGGNEVWLTTENLAATEAKMKSLFHAFARGLTGGGVVMAEDNGWRELERRGRGMRFFLRYAGLAREARPDRRVAILSTLNELVLGNRTQYACHAIYYHLTRLGFPPAIVEEEHAWTHGLPEGLEVLVIVRQQQPLDARTAKLIADFQTAGGKVVITGDSLVEIPGAIVAKGEVKSIWDMSGFHPTAHEEMWEQFLDHWRQPLAAAMAEAGIEPRATCDPELGYACTFDVGEVRYVAVIADRARTHQNSFAPTPDLPLSLAGTGWTVRDLATQTDLPTRIEEGRTVVEVDLANVPAALLALYRQAPAAIELKAAVPAHGGELTFTATVPGHRHLPVAFTVTAPDGTARDPLLSLSDREQTTALPGIGAGGNWVLTATEQLTGRSVTLEIPISPTLAAPAQALPPIHIVAPERLAAFAAAKAPLLVLVEPGQQAYLPTAEAIAAAAIAGGREARVWQLKPEDFDTIPLRWYPRAEDEARLAAIDRGELIGIRQGMEPFIDKLTAKHLPERGGYAFTGPAFIVGQDCVLFGGGRLAESLALVSPWIAGPPQARLDVVLSPYRANRLAVALLGPDAAAIAQAAGPLIDRLQGIPVELPTPPEAVAPQRLAATGSDLRPLDTPYANLVPTRRVKRLAVSTGGHPAIFLNGEGDNLVFIDGHGQVSGTAKVVDELAAFATVDIAGHAWLPVSEVTARHPGWGFPTSHRIRLLQVAADGTLKAAITAYEGDTQGLPNGHHAGWLANQNGSGGLFAEPGHLWLGAFDRTDWLHYADLSGLASRVPIRAPRFPIAAVFSGDHHYLAVSLDTRPRLGGMGHHSEQPMYNELLLLDARSAAPLWRQRDWETPAAFAIHQGFLAISHQAERTASLDYNGVARLIDRDGKIVWQQQLAEQGSLRDRRLGPVGGINVTIAADGQLAAFALRDKLVLVNDTTPIVIPAPGLCDAAVGRRGDFAVAAFEDGRVVCYEPDGTERWRRQPDGVSPQVETAFEALVLIATSEGKLLRLQADGSPNWEADLTVADAGTHPLAETAPVEHPRPNTIEPVTTLAFAKEYLGAKQLASWQPPFTGEATLEGAADEAFVHLVYVRPPENRSLKIVTKGKDGTETFWLDLPTPNARTVAIPVRGPRVTVSVIADGPAEIRELSLWSFQWPGANLAYVRPAGAGAAMDDGPDGGDDLLGDLGDLEGTGAGLSGAMKETAVYIHNPDPDQVSGPWLPSPVPPLSMVDGHRFGNGKLAPFTDTKNSYRGAWWVMTFPKEVRPGLVAWYERANRQSEVACNLAVFTDFVTEMRQEGARNSGRVLAGAIGNDQFWRLFPLIPPPSLRQLGLHVYVADDAVEGFSEIEVYPATGPVSEERR